MFTWIIICSGNQCQVNKYPGLSIKLCSNSYMVIALSREVISKIFRAKIDYLWDVIKEILHYNLQEVLLL